MGKNLEYISFEQIDLNDPFFDTLKGDYSKFEKWFLKKIDNKAYVHYNINNKLDGFLYLKDEGLRVDDTKPIIEGDKIVKIGTFKINPHGTRLGERFIKSALDYAIKEEATVCYVTIFEKHTALVELLQKYGFAKYGTKNTDDGEELVLLKNLRSIMDDVLFDYPLVNARGKRKFLLSIYPEYHSVMFPDSILNNESTTILKDVPYTNSIHKMYVCRMNGIDTLKNGDILVVYRTAEKDKSAEYSAVATSICVVENVRSQNEFANFEDFYKYACTYSVFNKIDLEKWYKKRGCFVIKMTYNIALKKRLTRHTLIESLGLPRDEYWGFMNINEEQFKNILEAGEVNESVIIY